MTENNEKVGNQSPSHDNQSNYLTVDVATESAKMQEDNEIGRHVVCSLDEMR